MQNKCLGSRPIKCIIKRLYVLCHFSKSEFLAFYTRFRMNKNMPFLFILKFQGNLYLDGS